MTRNDIELKLLQAIQQVQEMSGQPDSEINVNTCPTQDLPGFDSLRGVEVIMLLSTLLDCDIDGDVNLFKSKNDHRNLRIHEIVDRIYTLIR